MIQSDPDPMLADGPACRPIPNVSELVVYTAAGEMAAVYRDRLQTVLDLRDQLYAAVSDMNRAFGGATFGASVSVCGADDPDEIQREAKRVAWRAIIGKLGIEKVMSSKKRQEMREALEPGYRSSRSRHARSAGDPLDMFPDVSPEAIRDVLSGYVHSADEFLDEAIQEEYEWLKPWRSDSYKTNEQNRWKLSHKVIIQSAVAWDFGRFRTTYGGSADHLQNLDNVFHILDGQGFPESHVGPLCDAIRQVTEPATAHETEYFRFKCYKNGNLHLEFLRMDLVQEFNYRCGNPFQLPGQQTGGSYDRGKGDNPDDLPQPNGDFELFETPAAIAEEMCDIAGLTSGMLVLEPSSGRGRIALAARASGADVQCVEIQPDLAQSLRDQNFACMTGDFLRTPFRDFLADAVVMNPPFSRYQDIAHIRKAFDLLKPGGVLVSVASAGTKFRTDRRTSEFREWLATLGGEIDDLPPGSFSDEGTDVQTVLVTITKP